MTGWGQETWGGHCFSEFQMLLSYKFQKKLVRDRGLAYRSFIGLSRMHEEMNVEHRTSNIQHRIKVNSFFHLVFRVFYRVLE